ncbi:hypothetical protein SUGI_1175590 [Cryptomeria japonica]|nr:hypothetical protein SUGI_1175590 [Cryptomeria japonica]
MDRKGQPEFQTIIGQLDRAHLSNPSLSGRVLSIPGYSSLFFQSARLFESITGIFTMLFLEHSLQRCSEENSLQTSDLPFLLFKFLGSPVMLCFPSLQMLLKSGRMVV